MDPYYEVLSLLEEIKSLKEEIERERRVSKMWERKFYKAEEALGFFGCPKLDALLTKKDRDAIYNLKD